MGQTESPQTKVRCRVTDDTETEFDGVNRLINDDVSCVELNDENNHNIISILAVSKAKYYSKGVETHLIPISASMIVMSTSMRSFDRPFSMSIFVYSIMKRNSSMLQNEINKTSC